MEEKLRSIIEQSAQLFIRLGVKSLTMDDIAKQLRISKKTLYQFVSDKNDLVKKCIQASCSSDCEVLESIRQQGLNAIDELLAISEFVSKRLQHIHPSIFFDLEKYHPEAMAFFDQHRDQYIHQCIANNIQKGIAEGLYRSNLNGAVVTQIYLSCMQHMLHGHGLNEANIPIAVAYRELITYHLHGIASEQGIAYIRKLAEQQDTHTEPH
ncbi:MAG TPA: TetR/AcrR family transcriptional regulator [Luteibaculaceae bacterium]|nr:TetR/AcrR family transcriptional regulator [Luteibaculaceae bacterium]